MKLINRLVILLLISGAFLLVPSVAWACTPVEPWIALVECKGNNCEKGLLASSEISEDALAKSVELLRAYHNDVELDGVFSIMESCLDGNCVDVDIDIEEMTGDYESAVVIHDQKIDTYYKELARACQIGSLWWLPYVLIPAFALLIIALFLYGWVVNENKRIG